MANYMRVTKRDRAHSAQVYIERVIERMLKLKRRPRWMLNRLVHARDNLEVLLKGSIR